MSDFSSGQGRKQSFSKQAKARVSSDEMN